MADIQIEDYNEKCIAIFGDYTPYKADLEALGCLENEKLLRKSTNKRCPGMICTKYKRKQIEEFFDKAQNSAESFSSSSSLSKRPSSAAPKIPTKTAKPADDIMIANLLARVEKLEATVEALTRLLPTSITISPTKPPQKQVVKKPVSSDDEHESESSEEEVKKPSTGRLLKR